MFVFTMHKEGECGFPKQDLETWASAQWGLAFELVLYGGRSSLGTHQAHVVDSDSF